MTDVLDRTSNSISGVAAPSSRLQTSSSRSGGSRTQRHQQAVAHHSSSHHDDDDDHTTGGGIISNNNLSATQQLAQQQSQSSSQSSSSNNAAVKSTPLDFVEWGPPPDMKQRELIFDSLNKIVSVHPVKIGNGYNATYNNTAKSNLMSSTGGGNSSSLSSTLASSMTGHKGDSRGTYVFTWGAGYHGQLGRKFIRGQKKYSAIPMMVDMPYVIRQVACGGLHTAVVTEDGRVYTFGDGRKGELGHAHDPSLKQTPRLVEQLEHVNIVSVACGGSHTVAVSDNGSLYSFGWARYGQLGHGDRQNQKFPKKIEHPLIKDIAQVACGNKHTMAITKSGQALSWGANRHGQAGLGDFEDRLEPQRIESLRDIPMSHVACGAIHSCLVTQTGDIYICGFGEYFTSNESQHFFPVPKHIEMPEPIRSVSCGQAHNIALSVHNNVYTFGSGEYGQIGHGITGNSSTPRLVIDTRNIKQVSAGRYHSFALTDTGILYSFGCGENGQLGLNNDENILLPTVVTPILGSVVGQVSCGEHHTAILTSAPWTKLSQDVHEWLHSAKVEHELKELYLKKTHRGLTQKDLVKLAVEKEKWRAANDARKKEVQEEEKSYIEAESQAVLFERELQQDVREGMIRGEKEKLSFPPVQDATGQQQQSSHHPQHQHQQHQGGMMEEEEEKRMDSSGNKMTKLPQLAGVNSGKKKSSNNASGAQTERANTTNGGGAQAAVQIQPLDITAATQRFYDGSGLGSTALAQTATGVGGLSSQSQSQTQRTSGDTSQYSLPPSARTIFLKETAQMIRRMTNVIHDKGEIQSVRELNDQSQVVFQLRKEYDAVRNHTRSLHKKYQTLKKEIDLLESGSMNHKDNAEENDIRLQNLQMQLSTVTIKIAESSENRRNYELNIAHLKEEDFEHFNSLKQLRKQNTDTNLYVKKMEDLRSQSLIEKNKSEYELNSFKNEISAYHSFIQSQMTQFNSILDVVREQAEKREDARQERTKKTQENVSQRVEILLKEQEETEKESSVLSSKLLSLDLKLRHFESSFQKISSVTGLSDPQAIINKYYFKNEIREQLQSEIDEKQGVLYDMRRKEGEMRQELEKQRLTYKQQTWRDVEVLNENTRELTTRSEKAQKEIERVTQRLAFIQEGLVDLMKNVEQQVKVEKQAENDEFKPDGSSSSTPPVHGLWTPSQSQSIFTKLDTTVERLFASLQHEQKRREQLELMGQNRLERDGADKNLAVSLNGQNPDGAQQSGVFGFNMKHLRMLSSQNQMVEQHLAEKEKQHVQEEKKKEEREEREENEIQQASAASVQEEEEEEQQQQVEQPQQQEEVQQQQQQEEEQQEVPQQQEQAEEPQQQQQPEEVTATQ